MKSDKGITMMALVLTVVVMAILAGITINTSFKIIKEAELQDVVTNMLLIQAKVKINIEEVEFKTANMNDNNKQQTKKDELLGDLVDFDNSGDTDVIENTLEEILEESDLEEKWYVLSNDDLGDMGLYELMKINDETGTYLYTYDEDTLEVDILFTDGYVHTDKNRYYKLSELVVLQNS